MTRDLQSRANLERARGGKSAREDEREREAQPAIRQASSGAAVCASAHTRLNFRGAA